MLRALFFVIGLGFGIVACAQTLTTLYTFTGGQDGGGPKATLLLGGDGNFYGTVGDAVFKITPSGAYTTLHHLSSAEGLGLFGSLTFGKDGNLYGTATGSVPGAGTIFRITPSGTFKTLHTFNVTDGNSPWGGLALGTDGSFPYGGLTLGSDGNFYGTTSGGGYNAVGTVFKLSLSGAPEAISISANGVVNGANFQAGISPNSWATNTRK